VSFNVMIFLLAWRYVVLHWVHGVSLLVGSVPSMIVSGGRRFLFKDTI
jgi:hypothetical protein